jgi:hypothetical protein
MADVPATYLFLENIKQTPCQHITIIMGTKAYEITP